MFKQEATRLASMQIASTGLVLAYDIDKDRKVMSMPRGWPDADHETCVGAMFERHHTGLAIVTGGPSDLFVVDIDVGKGDEEGVSLRYLITPLVDRQ